MAQNVDEVKKEIVTSKVNLGATPISGEEFAHRVKEELKSLESLDHTECHLSNLKLSDKAVKTLLSKILDQPRLRILKLNRCDINDKDAIKLANVIAKHQSLEQVFLSGNKIGDQGIKALSIALQASSTLWEFDLSGNPFGDEGALAIAEAIKQNKTLVTLSLTNTGIKQAGAQALLNSLEHNFNLSNLRLGLLPAFTDITANEQINVKIAEYQKRNEQKSDEFLTACSEGKLDRVKELIAQNISPQTFDRTKKYYGETGLHKAARAGHLDIIQFLLQEGARPTISRPQEASSHGGSPLEIAERNKHTHLTKILSYRPSDWVPLAKHMREALKTGTKSDLQEKMINDLERIGSELINIVEVNRERLQADINVVKEKTEKLSKEVATGKQSQQQFIKELQDLKTQLTAKAAEESVEKKQMETRFKEVEKKLQKAQGFVELHERELQYNEALQNLLAKHFNYWQFYRTIKLKLEELFIGFKAIASGFIDPDKLGKLEHCATVISLLGQAVALIPAVGNTGKQIGDTASKVVHKLAVKRQSNLLTGISNLGELKLLERERELIATELLIRYQYQLEQILTSVEEAQQAEEHKQKNIFGKIVEGAKDLAEDAKELVLAVKSSSEAQQIAEFAVLKILEGLLNDEIKLPQNRPLQEGEIASQMLLVLEEPPGRIDLIKDRLSYVFGVNKLHPKDQKKGWSYQNFFCKPGLVTEDEQLYASNERRPDRYGYRVGGKADINRLHFNKLPLTFTLKQPKPVRLPQLVGQQASIHNPLRFEQKVEELEQRIKAQEEELILYRQIFSILAASNPQIENLLQKSHLTIKPISK